MYEKSIYTKREQHNVCVKLIGCSAEFENGTPEPWQREINP